MTDDKQDLLIAYLNIQNGMTFTRVQQKFTTYLGHGTYKAIGLTVADKSSGWTFKYPFYKHEYKTVEQGILDRELSWTGELVQEYNMDLTRMKIAIGEMELLKIQARKQACLSYDMQIEANLLEHEELAISYETASNYHKLVHFSTPSLPDIIKRKLKARITELLDGRKLI